MWCFLMRLLHMVGLFAASLVQGRVFAVVFLQLVQLIMYLDLYLDQLLLPEAVVGYTRAIFPPLRIKAGDHVMHSGDLRLIMDRLRFSYEGVGGQRATHALRRALQSVPALSGLAEHVPIPRPEETPYYSCFGQHAFSDLTVTALG